MPLTIHDGAGDHVAAEEAIAGDEHEFAVLPSFFITSEIALRLGELSQR